MIRVLVADDQTLVRRGLCLLFEPEADLEVVGEAADGEEAVRLAERLVPDVILMDLRMPGVDGITATRRIVRSRPSAQVLAVTTFDDDSHLYPALEAGVTGFVTKDTPPPALLDAVRKAADGDQAFSRTVLARLVERASAVPRPAPAVLPSSLTPRERDVLALVTEGLSNREIAERLSVSVTTIKTHVAALLTKTGRPNRIALAILADRAARP